MPLYNGFIFLLISFFNVKISISVKFNSFIEYLDPETSDNEGDSGGPNFIDPEDDNNAGP